jgi:hypothetical protein
LDSDARIREPRPPRGAEHHSIDHDVDIDDLNHHIESTTVDHDDLHHNIDVDHPSTTTDGATGPGQRLLGHQLPQSPVARLRRE